MAGGSTFPTGQAASQTDLNETVADTFSVPTPENAAKPQPDPPVAALIVTVRPPMIPVNPVGGVNVTQAAGDWQTFTEAETVVAVDYPTDWSVSEDSVGVKFTLPESSVIELQFMVVDNNKDGECTSLINSEGLSLELCGDLASNHYSANFILELNGEMRRVSLCTFDKTALEVYHSMLNTLRLTSRFPPKKCRCLKMKGAFL